VNGPPYSPGDVTYSVAITASANPTDATVAKWIYQHCNPFAPPTVNLNAVIGVPVAPTSAAAATAAATGSSSQVNNLVSVTGNTIGNLPGNVVNPNSIVGQVLQTNLSQAATAYGAALPPGQSLGQAAQGALNSLEQLVFDGLVSADFVGETTTFLNEMVTTINPVLNTTQMVQSLESFVQNASNLLDQVASAGLSGTSLGQTIASFLVNVAEAPPNPTTVDFAQNGVWFLSQILSDGLGNTAVAQEAASFLNQAVADGVNDSTFVSEAQTFLSQIVAGGVSPSGFMQNGVQFLAQAVSQNATSSLLAQNGLTFLQNAINDGSTGSPFVQNVDAYLQLVSSGPPGLFNSALANGVGAFLQQLNTAGPSFANSVYAQEVASFLQQTAQQSASFASSPLANEVGAFLQEVSAGSLNFTVQTWGVSQGQAWCLGSDNGLYAITTGGIPTLINNGVTDVQQGADGLYYGWTNPTQGDLMLMRYTPATSSVEVAGNVQAWGVSQGQAWSLTVQGGNFTFDGTPHGATGAVTTVDGTALGSPTFAYYVGSSASGTPLAGAPVDAGTYTVVASYTGSQVYTEGAATATISIAPATPTVSANNATFTADGLAHAATGMVTGLGGVNLGSPTFTYFAGTTLSGTPLAGPPVKAGTYTVEASYTGSQDYAAASSSATIIINPAAASRFVVNAPTRVIARVPTTVTVTVVDAYGNTVTGYTGTVLFSSSDAYAKLPASYPFTAADQGSHSFPVTFKTLGKQTLRVRNGANLLSGQALVQVTPTPVKLVIRSQPAATVTAGSGFGLVINVVDSQGNLATGFNGAVTLTLATNPGGSTLGGTVTVNAVNGVVIFAGLTLNKVGTNYHLKATSGSLIAATTARVSVTPAAATHLVVTSSLPGSVHAGVGFGLVVAAEDSFGNVATAFNGPVMLALASNPGGSTLGGTLTVKAVRGAATFAGLTLNKDGTGYILQATSGALIAAATNPFNVIG
jgi:hypothetical protein